MCDKQFGQAHSFCVGIDSYYLEFLVVYSWGDPSVLCSLLLPYKGICNELDPPRIFPNSIAEYSYFQTPLTLVAGEEARRL